MSLLVAILFLSFQFLFTSGVREEKYCNIHPRHLLCDYNGLREHCNGFNITKRKFAEEDKINYLKTLNDYRSYVAMGLETHFDLPEAANMREVTWDDELARIGQSRADYCKSNLPCSKCDDLETMTASSVLHYYTIIPLPNTTIPALNFKYNIVRMLRSQAKYFTADLIKEYKYSTNTDPYVNNIWATIDTAGCGLNFLEEEAQNTTRILIACVHGFRTDERNVPVYEIGPPCSACPSGTKCSDKYEGLCTIDENATTKLPSTTTEIPTTSTEILETFTEIPATITEIPATFTEIPETHIELPVAIFEIPIASTEIPETTTEIPEASTEIPETSTEIPEASTEIPTTFPEILTLLPELPTSISRISSEEMASETTLSTPISNGGITVESSNADETTLVESGTTFSQKNGVSFDSNEEDFTSESLEIPLQTIPYEPNDVSFSDAEYSPMDQNGINITWTSTPTATTARPHEGFTDLIISSGSTSLSTDVSTTLLLAASYFLKHYFHSLNLSYTNLMF